MTCLPEPSVSNAKAAVVTDSNDTVWAFFECLTGFSMSGAARISCNKTLDAWDTAPSCSVINDNVYVYNDHEGGREWWYYFLAALLTALLLLLLALVLWCWCWAPRSYFYDCRCCCIRQRSRRLHDKQNQNTNGVRKDVFWIDSNDNKYWNNQALNHYLYSDTSQSGSLTSLVTHRRQQQQQQQPGKRDVGVEAQLDSNNTPPLSSQWQSPSFLKRAHGINSSQNKNSSTTTTTTGTASSTSFRQVMAEVTNESNVDTPDKSSTPREAPITRTTRPAKDPSKEGKVWMPHTHTIRTINTSTK